MTVLVLGPLLEVDEVDEGVLATATRSSPSAGWSTLEGAPRVPLVAAVRIEDSAQRAHGIAARSMIDLT
jgi:hypothetical protein